MMKLVLLLLVGLVVWLLLTKTRQPPQAGRKAAPPTRPQPAQMIACAHCGVHLPQPDALPDSAGRHFCSEAHRLAGPR